MASHAYLVCDEKRTAYDLAKFLGTWWAFDWSPCDVGTLEGRLRDALLGEQLEYEAEWDRNMHDGYGRAYCGRLAGALQQFCERCGWRVRVVAEDTFWDEEPRYTVVGTRWDDDVRGE